MSRFSRLTLPLLAVLAIAACGGPAVHQTAMGSIHPPGWGRPAPPSAHLFAVMLTATMYDSITLQTVPARPFAVAGYTSGFWPTYGTFRRAWPLAHAVSIAVSARYHADCLDVEPGDATPAQAPGWVRSDVAAGFSRPCVYSSYWEYVNQVRPALEGAGIGRAQVFEWDADYTYVPHLDAGFDATQWSDRCLGRNLDCSLVTLPFLEVAQPPYVPPKPKPKPRWSFDRAFQAGFVRGFVVAYDRARTVQPPAYTLTVPSYAAAAYNTGFQAGFEAGW